MPEQQVNENSPPGKRWEGGGEREREGDGKEREMSDSWEANDVQRA